MGCDLIIPSWDRSETEEEKYNKDGDEFFHVPNFPINLIYCNVICALMNVICYQVESM